MKNFFHLFAGMLLLAAAGCNTTPKRVQVTPSNLNYMQVTYANTNLVVIMKFQGTGYCTMRKSTDPHITNPFPQRAIDAWDARLEISPKEMMYIFQSLVNDGVFEKEPKKTRALALPYVIFDGRIENTWVYRVSRTPKFLEQAADMLTLFEEAEKQRKHLR